MHVGNVGNIKKVCHPLRPARAPRFASSQYIHFRAAAVVLSSHLAFLLSSVVNILIRSTWRPRSSPRVNNRNVIEYFYASSVFIYSIYFCICAPHFCDYLRRHQTTIRQLCEQNKTKPDFLRFYTPGFFLMHTSRDTSRNNPLIYYN